MNRKQKIIVSVVGITIVLLTLLGLTYAYFLTRIQGNTNDKSISVTTANLILEYADINDELITDSAVEPGKSWTKTFVATNKGNATVTYGVALENIVNTIERKDDLVYTLDCKQYSKTGFSIDKTNKTVTGTISGTCNSVTTETIFPSIGTIIVQNEIADDKAQVYTLLVTYKEMNVDQSVDMNKTFSAKANLVDPNVFKPYGTNTLTTTIIDNANNATGKRTVYRDEPLTKPLTTEEVIFEEELDMSTQSTWFYGSTSSDAQPWNGGTNEGTVTNCSDEIVGKYISYYDSNNTTNVWLIKSCKSSTVAIYEKKGILPEKTLSKAEDDYGNSYYFRGNVVDNYIEFNNMCWRIVRIEGDGSIKIILAKEELCSTITSSDTTSALINNNETIQYGYKTINSKNYADYKNYSGGLYSTLKAWYTSSGLESKKSLLKNEKWCLGGSDNYRYNTSTGSLLTDAEVTEIENNNGSYYYTAGKRLGGAGVEENATFKCSSEEDSVNDYIGTISGDEVAYAGGTITSSNTSYYLQDNAQSNYWTLSRYSFGRSSYSFRDNAFFIFSGILSGNTVDNPDLDPHARPAITLATGTQVTGGDGTISNPYKVLDN